MNDRYTEQRTHKGKPLRLQSKNRHHYYRVVMYYVLDEPGIWYDLLVDYVADVVAPLDAHKRQELKRRKHLAFTPRVIEAGQRDIARVYIDRAHRYGRITYLSERDAPRRVFLGTPPASGGSAQVETDWAWEWNDLEDIHSLLYPDETFIRREAGVESAGDSHG